jgi:hypothetical protein
MEYQWNYLLYGQRYAYAKVGNIIGVFSEAALREYVDSNVFEIPKKFTHFQIVEKLEMIGYIVEMVRVY